MTPDSPANPPRRRGRGLSLRALMAVVLVVGGGMGYTIHTIHQANVQRDVVVYLTSRNVDVWYNWEEGVSPTSTGRPWAPDWLVRQVGVDYFVHIRSVSNLDDGTDELLAEVAKLGQLTFLEGYGSRITDTGIAHLRRLAHLEALSLGETSMTDAGLAHLGKLVHLKSLTLGETSMTDAGLAHLGKLVHLKLLQIIDNPMITNAGLMQIRDLTGLEHLAIKGSPITDAGLVNLARMTRLEDLEIDGAKIGDAGLEHLKALPSLKCLVLNHPEVTDAGLVSLKGMPNLQRIIIRWSNITDAGVRELKRARPDISVEQWNGW